MGKIKFTFLSIVLLLLEGNYLINAQTNIPYRWKNVEILGGGFVSGIIFSPAKKDVIYARTDVGGAYRWEAESNRWVPITDLFNRAEAGYLGIESIAPDPIDPDVVYMAVGMYIWQGNGLILKSIDKGNTWIRNKIGVPMGGNYDGRSMGERLAIDPNQTSRLYFGARNSSLMSSINSGATWIKVSNFTAKGNTDMGLSFVLFDKFSSKAGSASSTLFVGIASLAAGSNLYCTKDTGKTWKLVPNGPTGLMPHHAVLASDTTIYLAYNNGTGPNGITKGEVWKYHLPDSTWTKITPPGSGGGFGGISVDASDPKKIIACTLDWWAPDQKYLSIDGGKKWTTIGNNALYDKNGAQYLCFGNSSCSSPGAGWMGDIEIDPFNPHRAMYITGQGLWSSNNFDTIPANKVLWKFNDKGLEETVVVDMTSSVRGTFLSVVGDIEGMRHTSLDKTSAKGMYNPRYATTCLDFAGLNPQILARVGTGAPYGTYSKDNGVTWTSFKSKPDGYTASNSGTYVAVSADGSAIVWSPYGSAPAYSNDFGNTWNTCGGLPNNLRVASDRNDPNKFYAYSGNYIYVSTDGGVSFTAKASIGTFNSGRVRTVFGQSGELWVPTNSALFHSSDAGKTATKISNVQEADAVGFGKAANGKDYPTVFLVGKVNNVYGLYLSTDTGKTWSRINDNTHQFGWIDHAAGDELVFGRMYIGTGGRGILYGGPVFDCHNDSNGTAYYDACDTCVGGKTSKTACASYYDCNWVLGGTAYIDSCKKCAEGNTGIVACIKIGVVEEKIDKIKIAPNPFSDEIFLQISAPTFYKIIDILGNQVESGYCTNNSYVGQKLKSGIYILEVRDKNSTKTVKILKR
jgi:photosystem II stability/assembly factor-like uncharacterized protein